MDPVPPTGPGRGARWAVGAALATASALLYAGALRGAFVIDDRTFFIENDDLPRLGLGNAWEVFTRATNPWGDLQPLRDLLFLLQHAAFGLDPAGYHAVSLALYAATGVLAWLLAVELIGLPAIGGASAPARAGRAAPVLVAGIFIAHPVHVEAVAYVCGQKELLSALFSLGALLAFQRGFSQAERRAPRLVAGAVLYALAVLSKQTAVMLAILVPLQYLLASPRTRPPWPGGLVLWVALHVPIAAWMARSRAEFQSLWGATSAINALSFGERIPVAIKVVGAHARRAAWPTGLSFGYPFDATPAVDADLIVGVAVLLLLAAVVVPFRREPAVLLGAASFIAFLVPVMQLHGSLNNASIYDRYLFLPVLGLALVVERAVRAVVVDRLGAPRLHAAIFAALAAVLAWGAVRYVPAFADDIAVSRNSYQKYPGWSRPAFELAYSLVEAGRRDEARALLARERSLDSPAWVRPYLDGWMLLDERGAAAALPRLTEAASRAAAGGFYPFPSVPLARAWLELGRPLDAAREAQRAIDFPIYQPLEVYRARKLLEQAVARAGGR
jgi:hypothetical protein